MHKNGIMFVLKEATMRPKRPTANPLSRIIFFWVMACSCILVTCTVIFLSLGYRVSVTDNIMTLIYTGSIKYKSEPRDVTVTIDGRIPGAQRLNFINGTYHITGVRHGLHDVRIEASGYKPWEKTVRVRSGITTDFWNVPLVREKYEQTRHPSVVAPQKTYFSADLAFLAYPQTVTDDTQTLFVPVISIADGTAINTLSFTDTAFAGAPHENIEWSPSQESLIIPVERLVNESIENQSANDDISTPRKDYVITRIDPESEYYVYISEILPDFDPGTLKPLNFDSLSHVRWHPRRTDVVFFIADGSLYELTVSTEEDSVQEEAKKIAENVVAYDFADDGLYILDQSGRLFGSSSFSLTEDLTEITFFPSSKDQPGSVRLIAYDENRIAHITTNTGDLTVYNLDTTNEQEVTRRLETGIIDAQFSDDGKKLLFYSSNKVFVYFVRDWIAQPQRDFNTIKEVTASANGITSVLWISDYEHVITVIGDTLNLVGIDHRGGFQETNILTRNLADQNVVMNKNDHILYFTDKFDSDDFPILRSIVFPFEKATFPLLQ